MGFEDVEINVSEETINGNDIDAIIEPLWWNVNIYDGEKEYKDDLKKFTLPQIYTFAIEWYLAEVNNGGHDQFFSNSTGIVWEEALNGFKAIGIEDYYTILLEAVNRLGGKPNMDREKRQDQLVEYNADFEDLDHRIYQSESHIEEKILSYIRENQKEFLFKGIVHKPK
ncbi:DMP19 family protein [Saccharibacillus alkalitolerans]|uniref:DMP19 family protein n=1 Tax=Saccharibacillus alkalitolerans TaxID=2705290 RepID=A0ABX0FCB7_9BACL|nr:DMP19 family protein [Saccharibacillus alkalitolerans]NGZ77704.1 DMP19 family protein [Saccharibacillus alkalitolerans]